MRDLTYRLLYLLMLAGSVGFAAYALTRTLPLPVVIPLGDAPFFLVFGGALILSTGGSALLGELPDLSGPLGALAAKIRYPAGVLLAGGLPMLTMPDPAAATMIGMLLASAVLAAELWARVRDTSVALQSRWDPHAETLDLKWNLRWTLEHLAPTIMVWLLVALMCAGPAVDIGFYLVVSATGCAVGVAAIRVLAVRRQNLPAAAR
ncbi:MULTISPECIES: hypothetical protein [Brachybacterium]|uniref:Uncharacterized protein n=1 Tax=Brachybacterium kimchii TaxID=2942909 RepID=A0ABY4N7R0_9MICO|nr:MULTISPECIES: hypothetical protein [Brachybacterium]MCG7308045.1 hypothetical protein [Brachybacterium sp. ACRRE]UQN30591.1 hypothetical protein M4486_04560 [Brachybacterium kimchii]